MFGGDNGEKTTPRSHKQTNPRTEAYSRIPDTLIKTNTAYTKHPY